MARRDGHQDRRHAPPNRLQDSATSAWHEHYQPALGSFTGSSRTVRSLSMKRASLRETASRSRGLIITKHTSMPQSCVSSLSGSFSRSPPGSTSISVNSTCHQCTCTQRLTVKPTWDRPRPRRWRFRLEITERSLRPEAGWTHLARESRG